MCLRLPLFFFPFFLFSFGYLNSYCRLGSTARPGEKENKENPQNVNDKEFEEEMFLREREEIYEQRRRRIRKYCDSQPLNFSRSHLHLLWYPEAGISMCPINKIGSTTYIAHFGKLENVKATKDQWYRMQVIERFLPPNGRVHFPDASNIY